MCYLRLAGFVRSPAPCRVLPYTNAAKGTLIVGRKESVDNYNARRVHSTRRSREYYHKQMEKYCQQQRWYEAIITFGKMRQGLDPTVETYGILIKGYLRMCAYPRAYVLLDDMESAGMQPTQDIWDSFRKCFESLENNKGLIEGLGARIARFEALKLTKNKTKKEVINM